MQNVFNVWKEKRRPIITIDNVWFLFDCVHLDTRNSFVCDKTHDTIKRLVLGNSIVNMELCCGKGDWIISKAIEAPNSIWIGIDKKLDRLEYAWRLGHQYNLDNVYFVYGDIRYVIRNYIPSASIDNLYINFPDPWPKNKHKKNRLNHYEDINYIYYEILKSVSCLSVISDSFKFIDEFAQNVNIDKYQVKYVTNKDMLAGYGCSDFMQYAINNNVAIKLLNLYKNDRYD